LATTVLDVITASLAEIGVLAAGAGEAPTASQAAAALRSLNALIDQWKAERFQIHTITRTTEPIVASDGTYTIGSGGDVAIDWPVYVDHVNWIDTATDPDQEYPLHEMTDDEYAGIFAKALTSALPSSWYYNPTYPLGTLTLWPTPTGSGLEFAMYTPTPVAEFAATSDSVALPPGYRRMLIKNLAVELMPSYLRDPNPILLRQAQESLAQVKRSNHRLKFTRIGADVPGVSGSGRYNIQHE
jgi:hypothetical protein